MVLKRKVYEMCYISIIIPTFNAEKTILNCLNSILCQSFKDYEILIQDGNSSDNTLGLLSKFTDPRIKIISELDNGVYDAMNKAILRAGGEWIYFLGSDDSLYSPKVLENMVEKLFKSKASVVYGDVKLVGDGGAITGDKNNIYRGFTPIEDLITHNICHQAIFYRFSDLKNSGLSYEPYYPVQADHMLNIKMSANYSFEYVPQIIANFQHGGISSQYTDHRFKADLGIVLLNTFENQLFKKKFLRYRSTIRKASWQELKTGRMLSAFKGCLIYIKLKMI